MKTLINNCFILPMDGRWYDGKRYFKGYIGIESNKIALVTADKECADSFAALNCYVIDGKGGVVMPGFINAHTHVAMSLLRGYADDMPLMDWLQNKIWPFESRMTDADFHVGAQLGIAEMIRSGTTTFVDMYFGVQAHAKAVEKSGIRAYLGLTVMDALKDEVMSRVSRDVVQFHRSLGGRLHLMMAPHAPYTCSPETLKAVVEVARRYGLIIHTHLCETETEMDTVRKMYGVSPVEYYEQCGVFDLPVIAAHGVYLTESDADKLASYSVSVVHNAESNMKLASGVAPVAMLRSKGVTVAIGTDGASSNNNLDMVEELRTASLLQKVTTQDPSALDAYTSLEMATVMGAKALGREADLGQLKEGMLADMILIDINQPHLFPHHNLVSNIAYSATGKDVDTVIIDGQVVMSGRILTTLNMTEIYDNVNSALERLG